MHNGSDHYEHLELGMKYATKEKIPIEMRVLRVGDKIQYQKNQSHSPTNEAKILSINPDNKECTIQLSDNFFLSRLHSTHKVRKIKTRRQSETTWGYLETYVMIKPRKGILLADTHEIGEKDGELADVFGEECFKSKSNSERAGMLKKMISDNYKKQKKGKTTVAKHRQNKRPRERSTSKKTKKKEGSICEIHPVRGDDASTSSYETSNSYSIGYKFEKVINNKGNREGVIGTVVELGERRKD